MLKPQHKIGLQFIRRNSGLRKDVETIVDILTTYNSKNEVVGIVYVAEHDFLGQMIKTKTPGATIALSTIIK